MTSLFKRLPLVSFIACILVISFSCNQGTTILAGETWQAKVQVASEPERRLEWSDLGASTLRIIGVDKVIYSSNDSNGSFSLEDFENQTIMVEIVSTEKITPTMNYFFLEWHPLLLLSRNRLSLPE